MKYVLLIGVLALGVYLILNASRQDISVPVHNKGVVKSVDPLDHFENTLDNMPELPIATTGIEQKYSIEEMSRVCSFAMNQINGYLGKTCYQMLDTISFEKVLNPTGIPVYNARIMIMDVSTHRNSVGTLIDVSVMEPLALIKVKLMTPIVDRNSQVDYDIQNPKLEHFDPAGNYEVQPESYIEDEQIQILGTQGMNEASRSLSSVITNKWGPTPDDTRPIYSGPQIGDFINLG